MLKVENLSFAYKRSKPEVLKDFSLTFEPGHIYGLLGKNGVGKSTLLYLMSGLLTPKSGQVCWNGVNTRSRLPQVLCDFFIVPEEFDFPAVALSEFIQLNAPFYPKFSWEDMQSNLQIFEMNSDLNLQALSMGQKKKVYMSFALATHTSVLLMDEPTNGLDIPAKSQFRKLIASSMSDDRLIIISTHQIRDIDKVLDAVVIMDQSKVLLQATTEDIAAKLYFAECDDAALAEKALYSLPSMHGYQVVLPNDHELESDVNLELLFGAVLSHPVKFTSMFHLESEEIS